MVESREVSMVMSKLDNLLNIYLILEVKIFLYAKNQTAFLLEILDHVLLLKNLLTQSFRTLLTTYPTSFGPFE